jgi:EmrB/QacA subfamily drug resistance transporter
VEGTTSPAARTSTPAGRWIIAAAVLGSGIAFLDGTVVNAALPAIAGDLGAGLVGVQWVMSAYLLTLGALVVVGGSLGDLLGRRRVFGWGLVGFAATSVVCGVAPNVPLLIAARALQGVAAALLVPGSLAIVAASFHPDDRGRAIGAWSGLAGISTAIGPFLGGWLIDELSWRMIFLLNVPIVAVTLFITARHVPETRDPNAPPRPDLLGGALLAAGLAGAVYALIDGPADGWPAPTVALGMAGLVSLGAFFVVEARREHPMVPLGLFRSQQFSGANMATLAVYAGLGATLFFLIVHLQSALGYSALQAGAAFLPATVLMLLFSARMGAASQRLGARLPMTVGPLVMGVGVAMLGWAVEPGASYLTAIVPGVVVVGIGLTITVAPLTTAVLGAVPDDHAGIASAINNAVARIASLLAIAIIPALAGLSNQGLDWGDGYRTAMAITAVVTALGGAVSALTIRRTEPIIGVTHPSPTMACQDPCVAESRSS